MAIGRDRDRRVLFIVFYFFIFLAIYCFFNLFILFFQFICLYFFNSDCNSVQKKNCFIMDNDKTNPAITKPIQLTFEMIESILPKTKSTKPTIAIANPHQPTIDIANPHQILAPAKTIPQQSIAPTKANPQQILAPPKAIPQQSIAPTKANPQQILAPPKAIPQQSIAPAKAIPQQSIAPTIAMPSPNSYSDSSYQNNANYQPSNCQLMSMLQTISSSVLGMNSSINGIKNRMHEMEEWRNDQTNSTTNNGTKKKGKKNNKDFQYWMAQNNTGIIGLNLWKAEKC